MMTISVTHTSGCYGVDIGSGVLNGLGQALRELKPHAARTAIISETNVYPLYGDRVRDSLARSGFEVSAHVFPAGEASKHLSTVAGIYDALSAAKITRSDVVVALGGGVTGDIAGFAAATWLRGVDFVQVPTTLLAMIDSSIGGKTGVDLPQGKNLVGAFHQPIAVFADTDTLSTLPPEVFRDGLAEAVKHACILDREIFDRIADGNLLNDRDNLVALNVGIKADIVAHDEREHGLRALLNFGHTVGHAIEKLHNFTGITHGEAVAIGMVYAAKIGEKLGVTPRGVAERVTALLQKLELPTTTIHTPGAIAGVIGSDKKREADTVNFVLLTKIGEAKTHRIPLNELEGLLNRL